MPTLRSFIAIELPPHIQAGLERITGRMKTSTTDVRWVRTADIHLTLKFLGDVDEERVPELAASIAACTAGTAPFTLAVRSLGAFPNEHNPQIIWIGAEDESGRLSRMQQALETGLAGIGFKAEKRPFAPHLTLARIKSSRGKEAARRALKECTSAECGSYEVEHICLFKSDLTPGGAVYTIQRSFPLPANRHRR